jgi:O-antigen/teichoic acid export membrane protein
MSLIPDSWVQQAWKTNARHLVVLALLATFSQAVLWSTVTQMAEARRRTRPAQLVGLVVMAVHFLTVTALAWTGRLGIEIALVLISVEWAIGAVVLFRRLPVARTESPEVSARGMWQEFLPFCLPIVPYAAVGFVYEYSDRWLLQNFGGALQQGYFAAALQYGALGALATTAIINVLWKELAEAHYQRRTEAFGTLHRRVSRGLYFLAASVAGGLVPWARELVSLMLGPAFAGGAPAFAVMLVYPVHQALGQINGTTASATQSLSGYVMIGSASMLFSVGLTYFAVAPTTAALPGLGWGAFGLALKLVLVQIATVNVIGAWLARRLAIPFDWRYQLVVGLGVLVLGYLCRIFGAFVTDVGVAAMAVSGGVYCLVVGLVLWRRPDLAGCGPEHRDWVVGKIRNLARSGLAR